MNKKSTIFAILTFLSSPIRLYDHDGSVVGCRAVRMPYIKKGANSFPCQPTHGGAASGGTTTFLP